MIGADFDHRAVSKVEGLKLNKITAHKTFNNKFDQIRAGIKFIYFRDRLRRISTDKHATFDCQFRTCSFFTLQCKRMYFR